MFLDSFKMIFAEDRCLQRGLGGHVCRTKLPPKNFQIDTKYGLKNAKKDPKNDPKRDRKMLTLAPLRPLKIISPALFNKILKVFHRPKFAQIKVFFSPRGSAGVATPRKVCRCFYPVHLYPVAMES